MGSDLKEYKCPYCGGTVEWDASSQRMKCPFCEAEFSADEFGAREGCTEDVQPEGPAQPEGWGEGFASYVCRSCGGEIIAEETTGATTCPYCGNHVTMGSVFSDEARPDCILPFKKSKKDAIEAMKKHFGGKFFLPKAFLDSHHLEEVKGVYVPFWLFSATANVDAKYKATTVRHWSDRKYYYTETKYFSAERRGTTAFADVPVDGSRKMPDDMMESIEPYDYSGMASFSPAYMAGFVADKYDVDQAACKMRADDRMRRSSEKVFRDTVTGYGSVVPENVFVRLSDNKVKYALLPVWLLATEWNGKHYLFAMNGQTGKFVGDLPIDGGKAARTFFGLSVLFYGLLFAGQYLLWLFS